MDTTTQVLIAGAGPVGMTLALALSRQGISVRIVDKSPSRTGCLPGEWDTVSCMRAR